MESRSDSVDSKEVKGGLETSFTIHKLDSTDTAQNSLVSFENIQPEVDTFQPNTGKIEVLDIRGSQSSKIGNSSQRGSFVTDEDLESDAVKKKVNVVKSVSFRVESQEVSEEFDSVSVPTYVSSENSATNIKVLPNPISLSSLNSLKTSSTISRRNTPVLENIPEVDENVSEDYEAPGYYGWDGYEARFEESMADNESWSSVPECVPPWAKSVKEKYGLMPTDDEAAGTKITMQEKLENLMKKHKELMLLKRVESKKQLIVEPNKDPNEMDTVKMRAKSTRYYMAPLVLDGAKKFVDDHIDENEKVSLPSLSNSNSLSFTKKTPKLQAKKETSQVLKSLQKVVSKKSDSIRDYEYKVKKENDKCPKITLSNIREFVNMSPDERKLHEIIKIEKVPSVQDLKERCKPSSKYIINIPKNTTTDKPTVNVIKIKEKRKLRVDSIENIEEKVTELHYNHGTRRQAKRESDYIYRESCDIEPKRHTKTTTKSPTETKTFEVKTRQTPLLAPLIHEEGKKAEKVLLLQYDKKSKKDKRTTQLVGIKEPYTSDPGEMYLYGSETKGESVTENLTAGQEIPLTLKDKVHSIFEELRGLKLKQDVKADMTTSEVQVRPSVDTKVTQRPSHFPGTTEVAMVEAKPDVRSAAVQVRESQILEGKPDSFMLLAPHPTPTSDFKDEPEKIQSSLDKDTLNDKLEDLVLAEESLEKPLSFDKVEQDETTEQESLKELQGLIEEDKMKMDTVEVGENKLETNKAEESAYETMKEEKKETKLQDSESKLRDSETKVEQSYVADEEIEEKEVIDEDTTKETTEKAQEDTLSELSKELTKELSKEMSKELSKQMSKESTEQLEEDKQHLSTKEKMRKISKSSSKVSRKKSILQSPQDKDFEKTSTVFSDEIKRSLQISDDSGESNTFFKTSFPKEYEDIRSYEFGSQQGAELVIKSSSKFVHQKDDLRKKMNWTNDTIYLENNTCPQLIRGLAETATRRPADPIAFLAHWIYKDCESRERGELEEVRDEHLQLARGMAELAGGDTQTRKKFHVKKYPINLVEEEKQSNVFEEVSEYVEDSLESNLQTNKIVQEA